METYYSWIYSPMGLLWNICTAIDPKQYIQNYDKLKYRCRTRKISYNFSKILSYLVGSVSVLPQLSLTYLFENFINSCHYLDMLYFVHPTLTNSVSFFWEHVHPSSFTCQSVYYLLRCYHLEHAHGSQFSM